MIMLVAMFGLVYWSLAVAKTAPAVPANSALARVSGGVRLRQSGPLALDGWGIARHAREIDPAFPVINTSGDSAEDCSSKGVPNSIMLQKPFAPVQLVTAVSHLLNTGTPTT